MQWSIEFAPLVPWFVLAVAALAGLVLAGLLLANRGRGALLRMLSLAAIVGALANPSLRQESRQGLANIALIAVDRSDSQALANRRANTGAILAGLQQRLKALGNLDVRTVDVGKQGGENDHGTELFGDLSRALAAIPPERLAGVFVVTDGQIEDVPKSVVELGLEAPVHALLTGRPDEFDRRITVVRQPRYGLVGSEASAVVKVEASGNAEGAAKGDVAQLKVRREGKPDTDLTVTIGEPVEIGIGFPHAGANIVEVELAPLAGELTEANNRVILSAEGVRENLRVLLVSGEPHAGERTWRNLLKSDAAVDLVHFTILRPPQKQDGTPINELSLIAFPTRELFSEKLDEFDLIIFDRYQRQSILPSIYIDNIARFVEEKGGAVLVAAGDDYASPTSLWNTPLAQILPAEPTGQVYNAPFKPVVTETGRMHPVTDGLANAGEPGGTPAWGRWFRMVETNRADGQTVMEGPEKKPLLVLSRKGKGRIALLLSDHVWLWARGVEGGGPHIDLLRRLGHWLMKEPDLEEEHLKAAVKGMRISVDRRSMSKEAPPLSVIGPDGKARDLTLEAAGPGKWHLSLDAPEPGLYRFKSADLEALAHAGADNSREFQNVTATADPLAPLLKESGGGPFWPVLANSSLAAVPTVSLPRISLFSGTKLLHGSDWAGLADRDAHLITGVKLTPLVSGFAALALLLGLASLAWWREGR